MRKFFSPLKGLGQYLRFLFITGISKFSQLSIFSELNNLKNISMRDDFSALCGITEQELLTQLKPDIERMAEVNGETYEEACAHLKRQYDGYHFSKACPDIYNPFSLFNAFDSGEYKNYWFSTGTPTFLIDILQHVDFDVRSLDGLTATEEQFDAPTDQIVDPIPVLYQSGYLTIKAMILLSVFINWLILTVKFVMVSRNLCFLLMCTVSLVRILSMWYPSFRIY